MERLVINGRSITPEELEADLRRDGIEVFKLDKELDDFLSNYYDSYIKRVIMGRRVPDIKELKKHFEIRLKDILTKEYIAKYLPDADRFVNVFSEALINNKKILLVTDYDVDGVTSGVIFHKFMKYIRYDNFDVIQNKREWGNGINANLVSKIISMVKKGGYELIITSDHGSHDKENIKKIIDETGVKFIVTDHHLFDNEDKLEEVVDAFVNPQRYRNDEDRNDFKDITGTNVLYFALLYYYLNHIDNYIKNKLYYLLTYVGITIISDCANLANYVNRKILKKSLELLNNIEIEHDEFWTFTLTNLGEIFAVDEIELGFNVIPKLNTPGRIGNPKIAYDFMVCDDSDELEILHNSLVEYNQTRKKMQKMAINNETDVYENNFIKVMLIEEGEGIQGIIANNVLNNENKDIVICLTRNNNNDERYYIGSGRAKDVDLNAVLKLVAERNDDLVISFGGHEKAVGVKIKEDLKRFFTEVKKAYNEIKGSSKVKKIVVDDYIFSVKKILLNIFDILEMAPYGTNFPKPIFASDFRLVSYRFLETSNGKFLIGKVSLYGSSNDVILSFFYPIPDYEYESLLKNLMKYKNIRMIYSIAINVYRDQNKLSLEPVRLLFKE